MKFLFFIIPFLFSLSFADPVSEPFKSFDLNPMFGGKSTAWTINGNNAKKVRHGKQTFCNYAGRVSIKETPGGICPDLTIRHLKTAYGSYDEENGKRVKCRGAVCEYDITQPGGAATLTAIRRKSCPDIIVSMIIGGRIEIVGEWNMEIGEDPGEYYSSGHVEIPMNFDIDPMFVKFMGLKYENQLDFWYAEFQKWEKETN